MRPLYLLPPLLIALAACDPAQSQTPGPGDLPTAQPAENPVEPPAAAVAVAPVAIPAPREYAESVVRINSTQQTWNPGQPWEKNPPAQRRALGAIVGPQQVLTTAEMVADATYLEFESPDGTRFAQAKVIAVDYEADLALLGPASDAEGGVLFADTKPLEIAEPSKIGDSLDILQIEDNGQPLLTPGLLRSVDVISDFLPGQSFLTYLVKASMQSSASSFSLPVLAGGKFAGVLVSYDSKDQICDVTSTDIVIRFLKSAAGGHYQGFPSLGIGIARTEDTSFRAWLGLAEDQGGIYVQTVRKGSAAETAGVKKGDVLLALDGNKIDRRGYYTHPNYGSVFWGDLIRGGKATGESVKLSLLRGGKPVEIEATLTREEESAKLIPGYTFGQAPNFLVKGGFVFQELSLTLLQAFGKDWKSRAPLNFLDALENPDKYEDKMDRVVFLSGSIPTPATVGYESLRNLIVRKVNGKPITDMKSLIAAFDSVTGGLHSIEFDEEDFTVYLDDAATTAVDTQLLQRGLNRLSRAGSE